jgi:hypothetical protein
MPAAFLKLWTTLLDDPEIHALPHATRYGWIAVMLGVKDTTDDGTLPDIRRLALAINETFEQTQSWVLELERLGLIEEEAGYLVVHGWARWQAKKDVTAATRQQRCRANKRAAKSNPPAPPREEEEQEERREEGVVTRKLSRVTGCDTTSPTPPLSLSTPKTEEDAVCDLAATIGGDIGWATWASNRIRMGDTPQAIEAALSEAVDAKVISTSYVGKILKRYATEGVPEMKKTSKAAKAAGIRPSWGAITPKEAS